MKTNEVLYQDDCFIVYDAGDTSATMQDFTALVLKIGTNENNPRKPIRQLITRCGSPIQGSWFAPNATVADLENIEKLQQLGFAFEDVGNGEINAIDVDLSPKIRDSIDEYDKFTSFKREIVSVHEIERVACVVQYVARLALLALGDMRQKDIIDMRLDLPTSKTVHFETDVPLYGEFVDGEWLNPKILANDELQGYAFVNLIDKLSSNSSLHLDISEKDIYIHSLKRDDADSRIRIAAQFALSIILCAASTPRYAPSHFGYLPTELKAAGFLGSILEAANDGRLVGCPHCGWPVLKPHHSSNEFCRQGHRNKFDKNKHREAAAQMIREGKTIAQIEREYRNSNGIPYLSYSQLKYLEKHLGEGR